MLAAVDAGMVTAQDFVRAQEGVDPCIGRNLVSTAASTR
jgi:hypothetical protein